MLQHARGKKKKFFPRGDKNQIFMPSRWKRQVRVILRAHALLPSSSDQAGSLFWRGHLWMPEALWYSVKASTLNIKTHVGAFLCRIPHMPRWKRQKWRSGRRNPDSLHRWRKFTLNSSRTQICLFVYVGFSIVAVL